MLIYVPIHVPYKQRLALAHETSCSRVHIGLWPRRNSSDWTLANNKLFIQHGTFADATHEMAPGYCALPVRLRCCAVPVSEMTTFNAVDMPVSTSRPWRTGATRGPLCLHSRSVSEALLLAALMHAGGPGDPICPMIHGSMLPVVWANFNATHIAAT